MHATTVTYLLSIRSLPTTARLDDASCATAIRAASAFARATDLQGKDLQMGDETVTHRHAERTAELASAASDDHGVILRYLRRSDKQNKTGPSVLCGIRFRTCMRKGIDGAYGRPEPFKGTHAYFSMQSTYLLIFFSRKLSNLERVRNAAFVVGILRRWRCFVKRNKELTLKLNFVASQTYSHVLASCQVAVLQIKAVAHLNPHLATCLERTGSNYCEKTFSGLGGYGKIHSNHRDFNESDAVERLSNLLTLEKLEGGKQVLTLAARPALLNATSKSTSTKTKAYPMQTSRSTFLTMRWFKLG